jgi:hypothetical protein
MSEGWFTGYGPAAGRNWLTSGAVLLAEEVWIDWTDAWTDLLDTMNRWAEEDSEEATKSGGASTAQEHVASATATVQPGQEFFCGITSWAGDVMLFFLDASEERSYA